MRFDRQMLAHAYTALVREQLESGLASWVQHPMKRKVRWLAVLALAFLLRRRVIGRCGRGSVMPDERPDWHYAIGRLRGIVAPPLEIAPPPPGIRFEHNVEVTVRDGTNLRVNVFRPERDGSYPIIMCAHPYEKDHMPKRRVPFGYRPPLQYRIMRQPEQVHFSAWTAWESPDPAYWVGRGYAVVNCDLRGFGASDGHANLLTDTEARDYYDLIEWAGIRPWSNGKVGLSGPRQSGRCPGRAGRTYTYVRMDISPRRQ